jgi:tetrahydromethanopterin S-methyltransferase subunit B
VSRYEEGFMWGFVAGAWVVALIVLILALLR